MLDLDGRAVTAARALAQGIGHATRPSGPTAEPVGGRRAAEPVDLGVLHGLVTRWLREQRHGNPAAVCWVCPRDAAGLVARVEAARVAGLL